MSPPTRPPSFTPRPEMGPRRMRDPYADLLRDSRGLRRDQAAARDAWYASLTLERKEETLFELEMLLKGVACWGNARNHPSLPRRPGEASAIAARNFQPHLAVARAAVLRCLSLSWQLLGRRERPVGYCRYLAPAYADDASAEATRDVVITEGPEDALNTLRHALVTVAETMEGLLRTDRIPYRLFYATTLLVQREVTRNAFFNPLLALEFRPEFDRVRVPEILDAIQSVENDAAHRLAALTFLGCFRLLRLTQLLHATALDPASARRAYVLLAALRSDARELVDLLRRRAAGTLADGLERELMAVPAQDVRPRFEPLAREAERLLRLRVALHAIGASLRAELRRVFTARVPPCDAGAPNPELSAACLDAAVHLREALQSAIARLTATLRGPVDTERLFGDRQSRRLVSERGRQSIWIFMLVTRAFVTKARDADTHVDSWAAPRVSQGFIDEYLAYFRAVGHQLLLETDYPEARKLAWQLESLAGADFAEPARLQTAATSCEALLGHLQAAFERAGKRDELREHPFDKQSAAESLRMYMGL